MKLREQNIQYRLYTRNIWLMIILLMLPITGCNEEQRTREELYEYATTFMNEREEGEWDSIQMQMLSQMKDNIHNDSLFYASLHDFSKRMFQTGRQSETFEFLRKSLPLLLKFKPGSKWMNNYKSYTYLLLGLAADRAGLSTLSHEYYFKGLDIASQLRDTMLLADFYNNIGAAYLRLHNLDKASEHFEIGLKMAEGKNYRKLICILNANMAEIATHKNQNQDALDYMLRSIQSMDSQNNPDQYYISLTLLGNCYLNTGNMPLAYSYLSSALNNLKKGNNINYMITASMALVNFFGQANQPDSVAEYMELTGKLADKTNNPESRARYLEGRARYEVANGHPLSAYNSEHELRLLRDSLSNKADELRTQEAGKIHTIEQQESNKERGIASWNPVVVFVVMSIFVCTLIGFIIWILIMKRKKDRANTERAEAAASLAEIRQKQLEEQRAYKQKADKDLRHYHQKLTTSTLERLKISQQIEHISTNLKRLLIRIPRRDKENYDTVKDAISQLASIKYDTQWQEFQLYFDKVHPDFYSRLDKAHPTLTAKERRLCALLSLGLSSKEIASINFMEARSVDSSRNRLRKKLDLEDGQNLFEYISTFARPLDKLSEAVTNTHTNIP